MKYVAEDKLFKLTDEEMIEKIKTDRPYINLIIRQRMYLCVVMGMVLGAAITFFAVVVKMGL